MNEQDDRKLSDAELQIISEPGDVGEEQMPSGIKKTDKVEWNYADNDTVRRSPMKFVEDWGTKDWGYRK